MTMEMLLRGRKRPAEQSSTSHGVVQKMGRKHSPAIWHAIQARLAFFQCYLIGLRHRAISNEKR
ncbi:uncharacterized protein N7469_011651 [Penicillium citrinum]|uniref:Uncharacterized protein n=1 Tax=Penicillium citrinum TaxID=5077 RepID=A0A9W9N8E3_PENCI|nr:uncharacterized protein N7469_011651 [Penicillium citrinum]KAJ5215160.1 hypothetical protein N7469_011651 [Penicillium citrinum]